MGISLPLLTRQVSSYGHCIRGNEGVVIVSYCILVAMRRKLYKGIIGCMW